MKNLKCPLCGPNGGERLPLSDDDLWRIYRMVSDHGYKEGAIVGAEYKAYARAIEAAHNIKALKDPKA